MGKITEKENEDLKADFVLLMHPRSKWLFWKYFRKYRIEGSLWNISEFIVYKGIEVEFMFYSRENELLFQETYELDRWLPPRTKRELIIDLPELVKKTERKFNHFDYRITKWIEVSGVGGHNTVKP
ncbi:hypothetical protein JSO53_09840 [Riemerella anatipestifer]|uniref:hypothetical protein n=5 Tax=Riemerella anatipestifer TaxID=34085 RepID=UPI0002AB7DC8|nr:hypothetical protein [Riemerella anatipestifer]AGC41045.1 hypothetical protein G148_1741 [Riemerella anatipestifer RA-CH-2]AKQ40579.1 hypothetical protein AS87_09765 [Riemerella anatipestifer Yb2]MBF2799023.1 hypothetical protein [Riemerella anatipestifer]MCO7317699.1 hypothetical protein [Riemerella anatipestifer]MCQ4038297.1 hypothetical protein [Riemerella anatipestifer]